MATLKASDKDKVTGLTPNNPTALTSEVYDAMKNANTLGRYDDFETLKIPLLAYKKSNDNSQYGIKHDPSKHNAITNGGVIFDHQENAARRFLSELRGFGLLADCVGSGKTYEACVILSELAYRGKAKSILIIVPDEQLKRTWKHVLEMDFGFGKDKLIEVDSKYLFNKEPQGAFIITQDEFAKLPMQIKQTVLFSVIVVDEAHNLCLEEDGKSAALEGLSYMMKTKKAAGFPYCLLLSATPHSGNLANMFKLWYFVRCRGGNPADFSNASKSYEYQLEQQYYLNDVCNGASTVAEYIEITKCKTLMGVKDIESADRNAYLSKFEGYVGEIKKEFPACTFEEHERMLQGDKKQRCNAFLNLDSNEELKNRIIAKVAQDYHNKVMRSIMIRQPNNVSSGRNSVNYFFMPIKKGMAIEEEKTNIPCKFFIDDKGFASNQLFTDKFGRLIKQSVKDGFFAKGSSAEFYSNAFGSKDATRDDRARKELKVVTVATTLKNAEEALFESKCEKFVEVINEIDNAANANNETNRRAVVFFDYDAECNNADEKKASWNRLKEYLNSKSSKLANRIIYGNRRNIKESIEEYNKRDDAILFAEDYVYTEGQNLQKGYIVLNFEVSPDPLTLDQRIGRVFRLGQNHDVTIYSFAALNALEGYCLSYFIKVDLISDSNGDATIIAGSNNEDMIALQCPKCKKLRLISEKDYIEKDKQIRCVNCGEVMKELTIAECECENPECGVRLKRSITGTDDFEYLCLSNDKQKLATRTEMMNGEQKHIVYCDKTCIIRHCKRMKNLGCPLTNEYRDEQDLGKLIQICKACEHYTECKKHKCILSTDKEYETACFRCQFDAHTCMPKPCEIRFNDKWEAKCPSCGKKIKRKRNLTFASYVRALYEFKDSDNDSFCKNFAQEVKVTLEIKEILKQDKYVTGE